LLNVYKYFYIQMETMLPNSIIIQHHSQKHVIYGLFKLGIYFKENILTIVEQIILFEINKMIINVKKEDNKRDKQEKLKIKKVKVQINNLFAKISEKHIHLDVRDIMEKDDRYELLFLKNDVILQRDYHQLVVHFVNKSNEK